MPPKINPDATKNIDKAFAEMPQHLRMMCEKLRGIVHKADPQIIEDWKWGPNFNHDGMVCNIWAFPKGNYASIIFQRGSEMSDPKKLFTDGQANKGNRTIKFTEIKQINEKILIAYVKEAVKLNTSGVKKPQMKTVDLPEDFAKLLAKNKEAKRFFDTLSFTYRKEYAVWISSAKRPETRAARLKKAIENLSTGKKDAR